MAKISNLVLKTEPVDWKNLKWFQDDLKKISKEDFDKLKQSLRNNLFIQPFNVWQDKENIWILDGHHRKKALEDLEKEGIEIPKLLPANFIKCKNTKDAKKFVLIYSSIYADVVDASFLKYIDTNDLDLQMLETEINLPDIDVQALLDDGKSEEEQVDEIKEAIKTKIKVGDLFEIGNHRLMCGDSTNNDDLTKLMNGSNVDMIFNDPPYDMKLDKLKAAFDLVRERIELQFWMGSDIQMSFLSSYAQEKFARFFVHDRIIPQLRSISQPASLMTMIVQIGRRKSRNLHDCWSNVIRISRPYQKNNNFNIAKPVALPWGFIAHYCNNIVLDGFGGYGSTLIAAEQARQVCLIMELEPLNCQAIINRFEKMFAVKARKI